MLSITVSGNFNKTKKFLKYMKSKKYVEVLRKYGQEGVDALSSATPFETGLTASSWGYEIHETKDGAELVWTNSNINQGVNIAVILQYGHGTRNGGYVQGRDYINPALRPIFDRIAEAAWKEVGRA